MKLYWNYEQIFPLTNSGKAHVTHNLYTCTKLKLCQSCLQVNSLQIEHNHFLTLGRFIRMCILPTRSSPCKEYQFQDGWTKSSTSWHLNRQVFGGPGLLLRSARNLIEVANFRQVEFPTRETKTRCWLNQTIWKICSSNWIISPKKSG